MTTKSGDTTCYSSATE